jgi:pyruvate dehydrogenase E2 component (dihydrolipoamide acetyltransferase)
MPTQILMPALSPTMEEGKLSKWHVKEGDEVHSGDILAEIETDKATMEFEAVDEGRIGKILIAEGSEGVKVNTPIAVLLGEGEDASAADIPAAMSSIKDAVAAQAVAPKPAPVPKPEAPQAAPTHSSPLVGRGEEGRSGGPSADPSPKSQSDFGGGAVVKSAPQPSVPATKPAAPGTRIFASPLARRIAQQKGIDLAAVAGSGPRGRIVKSDVENLKPGAAKPAAAAQTAAAPAPSALPDARLFFKPDDYTEIPHDLMRKSIAKRLTASTSNIPHFYLTIECRLDNLLAARARLNATAPKSKEGKPAYKISVNDYLVKAAALALIRVPECNASWTGDAMLRHKHADVGVAVALDFGLITPIVFHAEEKGLVAISTEVKALAARARDKKLKPSEYEGGTFAISNLGMFGIKHFTAVINPPHAGILAVGAGEARPVLNDGKLENATFMAVTMSCDHRVIDGATGARFLQAFKQFVEDPATMLL